ncbi:hypothetical protein AB0K00_23405 [Dactylosporangium sp. NPDC049525]|uniref:WapI family immunity protein n=1 Tax=Dactylosporangium sp. NPDC049525 TaxID=3154730 RepID=UPI00342F53AC
MLSEVEVVKLEAPGGATVELRVVDRTSTTPGRDPGALLVVEGIVDAGDGRAWTFRDACLTAAEGATLGGWLLRAAKGRLELPHRLTFAAPSLTFTLEEHDHLQPRVTIGFSLTAAPPWLGEERDRTYDYPVTLDLDPESLEAAAVDWERQLAR